MDEGLKTKFSSFKNGLITSRSNYSNNSYILRSASKNNVSRKQGIYSKFLSKSKCNLNNGYLTTSQQLVDNSRLQTTLSNKRRGILSNEAQENSSVVDSGITSNETEISSRDISRAEASGQSGFRHPNEGSKIQQNGRRGDQREENFRIPSPPRRHGNSPPRRPANFQPRRLVNSPPRRLVNSPPRRLANSPPRRLANSPPRRLVISPTREDNFDTLSSSKRTDISVLSKCGNRLSPRVLLTDFRKHPVSVTLPVRDTDGFLVPKIPMQVTKEEKYMQLLKSTKLTLNRLVDTIPEAHVYWLFRKIENRLENHFRKISVKNLDGRGELSQDKNSQIANWLHSSDKNSVRGGLVLGSTASTIMQDYTPSVSASVVGGLPCPTVSGYPTTVVKASYCLSNWTLIKGKEPMEVMVSGKLIDLNSREVIEDNHISSNIIAADSMIAQTACCVYILTGELQDRDNCIPQNVKRYFVSGKFPKEWKDVIKMWSILKAKEERHIAELTANFKRIPYEGEGTRLEDSRVKRNLAERDFDRLERTLNERTERNRMQFGENEMRVRELFEKFFREKEETMLRRDERTIRNERTLRDERTLNNERALRDERTFNNERALRDERTLNNERALRDERSTRDDRIRDDMAYRRKELAEEERLPLFPDGKDDDPVIIRRISTAMRRDSNESRFTDVSRYGRKRKVNGRYENHIGQQQKKIRMEPPSRRTTLNTPRNSCRLSFISQRTRSAARKQQGMDSFLCTPKSSKVNKIKSRLKTPMPRKGRRVLQDDSASINDSNQISYNHSNQI